MYNTLGLLTMSKLLVVLLLAVVYNTNGGFMVGGGSESEVEGTVADCPEGTCQNVEIGSGCIECPEDSTIIPGSTECRTMCGCQAGYKWDTDSLVCVMCPANHYSPEGSAICSSCPIFKSAGPGAEVCDSCAMGQFWENQTCHACPDHLFGDGVYCNTCPQNSLVGPAPPQSYYDTFLINIRKTSSFVDLIYVFQAEDGSCDKTLSQMVLYAVLAGAAFISMLLLACFRCKIVRRCKEEIKKRASRNSEAVRTMTVVREL